jgi:TusA-related sulfurtransferase
MSPKAPAGGTKPGQSPTIDLRGLDPAQARARAFQAMFTAKPGQKVSILVNSADCEREIVKWTGEVGHRFLKTLKCGEEGVAYSLMEVIKMEARR